MARNTKFKITFVIEDVDRIKHSAGKVFNRGQIVDWKEIKRFASAYGFIYTSFPQSGGTNKKHITVTDYRNNTHIKADKYKEE